MSDRRTQEERSAESREKLILAAMELLGTRGYAGTSLTAIGEKAGLSRGLVSHHFGTKEQCVIEVVRYIRRKRGELAERDIPERGLEGLERFLDANVLGDTAYTVQYGRAILTILVEAMTASEGLREVTAHHNQRVREAIEGYLAQAVELGELPPQDLRAMAVVIEGILRGVLLQWLIDPERVDREAAVRVLKQMVRSVVGSASSPGAAS